ncbi:MAG: cysteine--tRNA ligase [Herpetosiphon sp.]
MRLFDTRSQEYEDLQFPDGIVRMYVCGITPYDTSHLGHARVGVVYDTLRRFLEWRGLHVQYVQNVTDVDDPLFERARRDHVDWRELGERETQRYLASLGRLHVERPSTFVKATSVIDDIVANVGRLVELEHAYAVDGWVYYSVATQADFGAIFHADYATMLATANERGNNANDVRKRNPLDFVLWQPSQPDEPAWESPWGLGRPGWHIECSTMATKFLGSQVDIHGGGADLIFPHHAAEIAQAEPLTGVEPFVRAWMHVGMVFLDGEKMSKSLGNMVFVDEILNTHSANALRLAILNQPYRASYTYQSSDVAAVEEVVQLVEAALQAKGSLTDEPTPIAHAREQFIRLLEDDFNTPGAVRTLAELAEAIVREAGDQRDVRAAQTELRVLAKVLGLQF